MNIWEKVNVGSLALGIVAMGAMGIYTLSPSLSPSPSITYLDSLPECDEEDGTVTSDSLPVPACIWDGGSNNTGHTFIVIAP